MIKQRKNKKAVSLMLAYVLLIIIAISLSIGIYAWLKFVARGPEDIDKCPEGVSIIILDYDCADTQEDAIELVIKNKGRFNVSGYSIKGTDNKSQEAWVKLEDPLGGVEGVYIFAQGSVNTPLAPDAVADPRVFSYSNLGKLEKIEIEPLRIQRKKFGLGKEIIVFCEDSVIQQELADCD